MFIYWGSLGEAEKASADRWDMYGYRATQDKESFSQVLFAALGMPEVRGESVSNITMHQILRLAYVDQVTPASLLFRYDRFDNPLIRQAVGDLLCGIYDDQLYSSQVEVVRLSREFDRIAAELSRISQSLGQSRARTSADMLVAELGEAEGRYRDLAENLKRLKIGRAVESQGKARSATGIDDIRDQLTQSQVRVQEARHKKELLEAEVADSAAFIDTIRARVSALDDSRASQKLFGGVEFQFCPSCFSPIAASDAKNVCSLCRNPITTSTASSQLMRMQKNELRLQMSESQKLLEMREEELDSLVQKIPQLEAELNHLRSLYEERLSVGGLEVRARSGVHRGAGAAEQLISDLRSKQRLLEQIRSLSDAKAELNGRLTTLRDKSRRKKLAKSSGAIGRTKRCHGRL